LVVAVQTQRDFRAVIAISSGKTCEYSQSCHCLMARIYAMWIFVPV